MQNILWFKEISKKDIPLVGGKGANLGELMAAGLPVPDGFCVTVKAYYDHLIKNKLRTVILEATGGLDVEDNKALNEAAAIIQDAILAAPLDKKLAKEILAAYRKLGEGYVAVRSSATAEDLPSISENEHVLVKINGQVVYRRMKDLYYWLKHQQSGQIIEVLAMENHCLVWKKASEIYRHPAKDSQLYKIKTASGREITLSPNHSLIVLDENTLQPRAISIKSLKGNERIPAVRKLTIPNSRQRTLDVRDYLIGEDVVETARGIQIKNRSTNWSIQQPLPRKIPLTADFLYFLGLYVAEGSTYQSNGVIVTNGNPQVQRRAKSFLRSIKLYRGQKINRHSIRVYCKALVRLLHQLTGEPLQKIGKGRSCAIKKVPDFIFGLNSKLAGEFLKGCFDGDGYVGQGVDFTSTSELLAGGVIKLLEKLGLRFYLRRKKQALTVQIPLSEIEHFETCIGFEDQHKFQRLKKLIQIYHSKPFHCEFKENIEISLAISLKIREEFLESLPKKLHPVYFCPNCEQMIGKTSYYRGKLRFHCRHCRKAFYESAVKKQEALNYVGYDPKGRFLRGSAPWNKGLVSGHLSKTRFEKLVAKYQLRKLPKLFNGEILWDKIQTIAPIKFRGFVYDFCVPGPENFAAGIGGIITHNSASFAGQQATFLNVIGDREILSAVKKSWASLFEPRAVYYRVTKGFDHLKVGLSSPIQKMVQSDSAGVMFTVDTVTNDPKKISIEAAYGLGEIVVSGSTTPDRYVVNKRTLKIVEKKIARQTWQIAREGRHNRRVPIPHSEQETQKVSDENIAALAKLAKKIENHYKFPQDTEWAIENNKIFMVQSRPITTLGEKKTLAKITHRAILQGSAASVGQAAGLVKIIKNAAQLHKIQTGDVLVAKMTDPTYVSAMKKAVAIITDQGGQTSHAAIVSRELAIPAVVGTGRATTTLCDGQKVTVDGEAGMIYEGDVVVKEKDIFAVEKVPKTRTKIYVNLAEVEAAEKVAKLPCDGVGLLRAEFMIAEIGTHPRSLIDAGKGNIFTKKLSDGITRFAKAFHPRPVVYRATDFKTNEYAALKGGKKYEPEESNPMIGYRGALRYILEPEVFLLEIEALKKVRQRYKNVHLMLPFVRTVDELKKAKILMEEAGLVRSDDFSLYLMVEVPTNVIILEDYINAGIDGISIGSNDLTQLVLGLDRDNERIAFEFDERDPAVKKMLKMAIETANKYHIKSSICGQAPSVYPEIARFLVECGIEGMSVNPDTVIKTRRIVAQAERELK